MVVVVGGGVREVHVKLGWGGGKCILAMGRRWSAPAMLMPVPAMLHIQSGVGGGVGLGPANSAQNSGRFDHCTTFQGSALSPEHWIFWPRLGPGARTKLGASAAPSDEVRSQHRL